MLNIINSFYPRKIFVKYFLYNNLLLSVLNFFNKIRWQHIDLAVILWPPAKHLFEDIQNDIEKKYKVLQVEEFEVTESNFKSFVKDIYAIDYASENKIKNKIDALQRNAMTFRMLIIRIPKPDMYAVDILNRVRCRDINKLKVKIRNKYKEKIDDYIYDLIIHSTEVDYQTNDIRELFLKYDITDFRKIK